MHESKQEEVTASSPQGVTVKAFVVGLMCSAVVAGGTQYGEIYLRSSRMSDDFSNEACKVSLREPLGQRWR